MQLRCDHVATAVTAPPGPRRIGFRRLLGNRRCARRIGRKAASSLDSKSLAIRRPKERSTAETQQRSSPQHDRVKNLLAGTGQMPGRYGRTLVSLGGIMKDEIHTRRAASRPNVWLDLPGAPQPLAVYGVVLWQHGPEGLPEEGAERCMAFRPSRARRVRLAHRSRTPKHKLPNSRLRCCSCSCVPDGVLHLMSVVCTPMGVVVTHYTCSTAGERIRIHSRSMPTVPGCCLAALAGPGVLALRMPSVRVLRETRAWRYATPNGGRIRAARGLVPQNCHSDQGCRASCRSWTVRTTPSIL